MSSLQVEPRAIVRSRTIHLEFGRARFYGEVCDAGLDPFEALSIRGAKHIGFLVEDVDEVWERMDELGAELLSAPTIVEPAAVKNCFVRDPDGTMIEFDQRL